MNTHACIMINCVITTVTEKSYFCSYCLGYYENGQFVHNEDLASRAFSFPLDKTDEYCIDFLKADIAKYSGLPIVIGAE